MDNFIIKETPKQPMKHLETARTALIESNKNHPVLEVPTHLTVDGNTLTINIQDGTIFEAGINGIQITDLLEYVGEVYKSLDNAFPCTHNKYTIVHIDRALKEQHLRTVDRTARGVEGKQKA